MNDDGKIRVHKSAKREIPSRLKALGLWIDQVYIAQQPFREAINLYANCPERYFEHYSISHLLYGHGHLKLGCGKEFDVKPGDCIVITPGTINRYGGVKGSTYVEDALQFRGPVVDMMKNASVIQDGVFEFGSIRRLMPFAEYFADPAIDSKLAAAVKLESLLMEIYLAWRSAKHAEHPFFEKMINSINEYPEKWWTISELAEMCGISTTHLRRLFFEKTGLTPKEYIDTLKMNRASSLLVNTQRSITNIASSLGYTDPYHFSRRFKEITGNAPNNYRSSMKPIR